MADCPQSPMAGSSWLQTQPGQAIICFWGVPFEVSAQEGLGVTEEPTQPMPTILYRINTLRRDELHGQGWMRPLWLQTRC